ncbi:hypothetical protein [Natrinema salsiterrestre]|uniref:Uncharacterized protein n=1 Tax=Natrinema salsiterrestre TaxID=2950540 RepID=A0A9Q4L5G7_9EURY|nr:hypothetical protein [Natrinema salsiterrestre]MDF9746300.1 hypothetical protein [Natrinema salsiterrestre]
MDVPRTTLSEFDIDTERYHDRRDRTDALKSYLAGGGVPIAGERYLDLLEAGATATKTFRELEGLLTHYATTDVVPLFELADSRPFEEYA